MIGLARGEAQERPFVDEAEPRPPGTFTEPEPWMEQLTELPGYPEERSLIPVALDPGGPPFRYRIDADSLAVGVDQAVRYALVIEPREGAGRNVLFEAINCATEQYKTFARGAPDGAAAWRPVRRPDWRPLEDAGSAFRRDLAGLYFCDRGVGRPYPLDRIRQRVRAKGGLRQETFLESL